MKDTLRYLLILPRNEEFSMTIRIEMHKILKCFHQWSLEYHNAGFSATIMLSKANEVMYGLEANIEEFQVLDKDDKYFCNQLVCMQEQKRELEKKIKIIDVQIENSTRRYKVAKDPIKPRSGHLLSVPNNENDKLNADSTFRCNTTLSTRHLVIATTHLKDNNGIQPYTPDDGSIDAKARKQNQVNQEMNEACEEEIGNWIL
ncbi:hypothetical protein RYX36_008688 [Vicia faba]